MRLMSFWPTISFSWVMTDATGDLLAGLGRERRRPGEGDGLVFVGESAVRPGDHQHDVALGGQLREGLFQQFLAADARHRRRASRRNRRRA